MLFSARLPLSSLIELCRVLRHYMGSGLSLVDVFRQQAERGSGAVRALARRVCTTLESGADLQEALKQERDAFPPLLLFDEPFAALDPITRFDLQRQFLELRRTVRKSALFVTHDVREALMLGTRIALLKDGALDVLAAPAEFLAARTPEAQAFLASLEETWRGDERSPAV